MLTTADLLQLDPDKLLGSQSVEQAEAVARRLQREVDTKREELRIMVGERYRDLIEAADTIQKMKASSFSVINSLAEMQSSTNNLQQRTMGYSLPHITTDVGPSRANLPYLAVAASIKLLMSIPENIWTAVERGNLIQGAELYLLAQYVLTGLQGDMGAGVTADKVEMWFPVLARQAATITNFFSSIITSAKDQLMAPELSPSEALDACGALLALRSGVSVLDIFKEFLQLRQECLRSRAALGRSDSARIALCTLLRTVMNTVAAIRDVFVEGGSLQQLVERSASESVEPSVLLLGGSSVGSTGKFLPEPVKRFRPQLQFSGIPHQQLVFLTVEWLEQAQSCAVAECDLLLADIHTVQGVDSVRREVHTLLARQEYSDWNNVIKVTSGSSLNLWDTFYRDSVRNRVDVLLRARAANYLAALEADLEAAAADCEPEQNLAPYIWSEAGTDFGSLMRKQQPQLSTAAAQQQQAVGGNGNGGGGGEVLPMKCKGWSEKVQSQCRSFDKNLETLWTDIASYNTGSSEEGETFDRYADSDVIYGALASVLGEGLAALLDRLTARHSSSSPPEVLLLLGRFLQALSPLCPTLRTCLTAVAASEQSHSFAGLEALVLAASSKMFQLWSRHLVEEMESHLQQAGQLDLLAFLPAWDRLSVQECGEDELEVTSQISIPSLPSVSLFNSLHRVAARIHQAHPASMPVAVLNKTSQDIVGLLVGWGRRQLTSHNTQNFALQLAFNLKFVQTLLLSREHKGGLGRELESLIEETESHIDPFDLSVFLPHLETRVKRACARDLSALGCLVPADRYQLLSGYKPSPPPAGTELPNIMSLCAAPPQRFQLLPIAAGSGSLLPDSLVTAGSRTAGSGLLSSSVDPKGPAAAKSSVKRSRSPVSSTAASFFGSMSSSWFGGTAAS